MTGPTPSTAGDLAGGRLRVEEQPDVLRLTLSSPETHNAFDGELMRVLADRLRRASTEPDLRVVLLTGTGKAFSSGADLSPGEGGAAANSRLDASSVEAANALIGAITDLDKPVVCGLNGVAAGFGASVVLACDVVVATRSASFTIGFTKVGLMPDGGATATLPAAVGRLRAMRMALLSDVVGADEALALGLVSFVHDDADYPAALESLLERCRRAAPLAFAATKRAINASTLGQLPGAMDREHAGQPVLLRTDDVTEGMTAFVERRAPRFEGR